MPTAAPIAEQDDLQDREIDVCQQVPDRLARGAPAGSDVGTARGAGTGRDVDDARWRSRVPPGRLPGRRADRRPAPRPGLVRGGLHAADPTAARAAASAAPKSARRSSASSSPTEHAEQPRGDPGRGERRVVELAVRGARRMDDDRVDAAERRRQDGDRQRIDERGRGRAAVPVGPAGELEREHAAAEGELPRRGVALRVRRRGPDTRRARRHPAPRASARGGTPVRRGARIRISRVGRPRRTRNDENGASVAPVSTWTSRTAAIRSREPATIPARTSLWPDRYFVADSTTRSAPELERPADERRRERVVDDDHRPVAMRDRRQAGDVGHGDRRI